MTNILAVWMFVTTVEKFSILSYKTTWNFIEVHQTGIIYEHACTNKAIILTVHYVILLEKAIS